MSSILNMTKTSKFVFGQNVPRRGGHLLTWHKRNEMLVNRVDNNTDIEIRGVEERLTAEALRIGLIKSSDGRRA